MGLRNQVRNAWAQIDVQLRRRHDLIPNLVEAVKGYLRHEREVLERVTLARTRAVAAAGTGAGGAGASGAAEAALSREVAGLLAVMEGYPDLKAHQNVLALQEELTTTENRIGFARQLYNDLVGRYNTRQEVFPVNLLAGPLGFRPADFFQTDPAERAVPRVDLGGPPAPASRPGPDPSPPAGR